MTTPHRNHGFRAVAWRTRRGKAGIFIRIEHVTSLMKPVRWFWRIEDAGGGLIEASWVDAPNGYRAYSPCLAEARAARQSHIEAIWAAGGAPAGATQ